MKIDLHTHTTCSDGQYSPEQLVDMAADCGAQLLGITDHDTVNGLHIAQNRARERGLSLITGIEISTQDIEEIHILGYGINPDDKELCACCEEWHTSRLDRGEKIRSFLKEKGIDVNLTEVKEYAGDASLGRPHFAAWMLDHGIVKNRREAFDRYLDTEEFHENVERRKPSPEEAIMLIHGAGGKAVLAHPGIYRMDAGDLENLVHRLAGAGLDGMECFYSRHDKERTELYLSWAKRYQLRVSCGSDFHGEKVKPDIRLGMEFDENRFGERLIELS